MEQGGELMRSDGKVLRLHLAVHQRVILTNINRTTAGVDIAYKKSVEYPFHVHFYCN